MDAKGLVAYAAVFYILWGVTYTMMDIPYWSMIPAFTEGGKERENLTTLARTCAGVGSAIITIVTMKLVPMLGKAFAGHNAGAQMIEIVGFKYFAAIVGILFIVFIGLTFTAMKSVYLLFVPAFFIFAANGMLTVITTVFLANTVDYGELKNHRRDESVIFSMQTFVVKLASGIAALAASICLSINNLQSGTEVSEADAVTDFSVGVFAAAKTGLRMTMTIIPIAGLIVAFLWFKKKYVLTDSKVLEIAAEVKKLHASDEAK